MGIERSSFYYWKQRLSSPAQRTKNLIGSIVLFQEYHLKYPSHGYRWLNAKIRLDTGLILSDPYAHKCCKIAGIKSQAKHYRYKKPGHPGRIFPNLLSAELNIDGPLQCIVSDMTAFYVKGIYYELTLYMDLWNNEIVGHGLSAKRGDRMTYINGLEELLSCKKDTYKMILHSDQGAVYTSKAFNDLLPMYVNRSMSRAGTPTDNPVNESLNGWIKEELFMDFHLDDCRSREAIRDTIDRYVNFYNKQRPCYAIGYDTPNHYYQRYQRGELERKDTFSKRVLTAEPKFVQKRRQQKLKEKEIQGTEGIPETVSTSENGNEEKMSLVSTSEKEES